ncbi:hypothetical protein MAPG_11463, partial [Magnaporthiopsis poae ATCC 64411]
MADDGASSSAVPTASNRRGVGGGSAAVKASASSAKPQILTFSLSQRPRATRASQPKARTGCKTCDHHDDLEPLPRADNECPTPRVWRRHVKCDETKPACLHCVKWQGFCEGYEHLAAPAVGNEGATTAGSRQRRPKKDLAAASDEHSVVVWQPTEHQGMFAQDPDKIYFDHWLQLSDMLDGSWFGSNLWTRTIPQLSRVDPTLRYASMAIGALSQAMAMVPPQSRGPGTWSQASNGTLVTHSRHYRDAVVYYGRALRLARERHPYQTGSQDPNQSHDQAQQRQQQAAQTQKLLQGDGHHAEDALRAIVLSCILFLCFETIHGNRTAALRHLLYGGRVVASWVESCFVKQLTKMGLLPSPPQSAASSPSPEQPAEAAGGAGDGGRAKQKEIPLPVLGTSPEPYILQDEVLQVFQRLDRQAFAAKLRIEGEEDQEYFSQTHPQSISRTAYVMRNMSRRVFPNVAEARRKWDTISHWLTKIEQTIKMHSVPPSARQEELLPENTGLVNDEDAPPEGGGALDKSGHPLLAGNRFSPDPPSSSPGQSPSGDSPAPAGETEAGYPDWDQLNTDLLGSFGAAWAP